MIALIDSDLLCYRIAYTTTQDKEWVARARLREMIGNILKAVNTEDYKMYLSDSKGNFRLEYFPNYKANRPKEKPPHLAYLQNLIVDEWGAEVAWGQEADDALGIEQTRQMSDEGLKENEHTSIICSIDKDLLMIPGAHYNFVKEEMTFITPEEGLYRFYKQLLTGDPGDNITVGEGLSCKGIGAVKADKILEGYNTESEYFLAVQRAYRHAWNPKPYTGLITYEEVERKLLTTGRLLKIRTKENEIWEFPGMSPLEADSQQSSSGTASQGVSPS